MGDDKHAIEKCILRRAKGGRITFNRQSEGHTEA